MKTFIRTLTTKSSQFTKLCEQVNNNPQSTLQFLKQCQSLDKSQLSTLLIVPILSKSKVDSEILRNFWVLHPEYSQVKKTIDLFYEQNRKLIIPEKTVMIPFRKLIWDGQLDNAIDLIDSTVGSERYLTFKGEERNRKLLRTLGKGVAFIGGLEILGNVFLINYSGTMISVYLLILTYLGNMSFLLSMAFSNRKVEGILQFTNGTFQKYWYQHQDEMKFFRRIVELDLKLNDKDQSGFVTRKVVNLMADRQIEYTEPEQEIMMRQYWLSGGDGFVWCEPDLEPAELLWDNHLQETKTKLLK